MLLPLYLIHMITLIRNGNIKEGLAQDDRARAKWNQGPSRLPKALPGSVMCRQELGRHRSADMQAS